MLRLAVAMAKSRARIASREPPYLKTISGRRLSRSSSVFRVPNVPRGFRPRLLYATRIRMAIIKWSCQARVEDDWVGGHYQRRGRDQGMDRDSHRTWPSDPAAERATGFRLAHPVLLTLMPVTTPQLTLDPRHADPRQLTWPSPPDPSAHPVNPTRCPPDATADCEESSEATSALPPTPPGCQKYPKAIFFDSS